MAQYKHLPIYKTTYDLLQMVTEKTKNFPKDFKFSLGDKLRNECIDLVVLIYKTNSIQNGRKEYLKQMLEKLQVVELILRLSKDMRLINVKSFSEIVLLTDSLSRQSQGWMQHSS